MTVYQMAILGLMIVGTVIIPLGAWIYRLQNRLLLVEHSVKHIEEQRDDMTQRLDRVEQSLTSIDKNLSQLIAVLKAKDLINGNHRQG